MTTPRIAALRAHLRAHVEPLIAAHEQAGTFPRGLLRELAPHGLLGSLLSVEDGGDDLDPATWSTLMEELGAHWASLRAIANVTNMSLLMMARHADAAQRERFMQPVLRGEKIVFSAVTEPLAGSNVAELQATATRDGDGYVIDARKRWVSNGAWGDVGIVAARTYSDDCDGKLSLFFVERAPDGRTPWTAEPTGSLVFRSVGLAELHFDRVRVPRSHLLGREGGALKSFLTGMDLSRLSFASGAVGMAQRVLDETLAVLRRHGSDDTRSIEAVARMATEIAASRALGQRAAAALSLGDGRMACSIAKLHATEAAHRIARDAQALVGPEASRTGSVLERMFRDTRAGTIPEGTSEVQTLIIGRELLGLSAF
jgi:alkylation response protein AidB-like acyl-CoA dehydrogenase